MVSIRAIAHCLGVAEPDLSPWIGEPEPPPPTFWLARDFFGYAVRGHANPLSLRTQIRLVQGFHINVNLILVGEESFTDADRQNLDQAVENMRGIFSVVPMGIGRVGHYLISEEDANDIGIFSGMLAPIFADAQALTLTEKYTVSNKGLDVFILRQWDAIPGPGLVGRSAVGGPCDKNDSCVMTGSVVSLEAWMNHTLAHEVGHYLGLGHFKGLEVGNVDLDGDSTVDAWVSDSWQDNLMFPVGRSTRRDLDAAQRGLLLIHCFIRGGC
jgi:Metallo-peptidase family M12B Reprolysin-like